jgi:hypothetical protein
MAKLILRNDPFSPWPRPPIDPDRGIGVYHPIEIGTGNDARWVLGEDSWYCQPGLPLEGYVGRTIEEAQLRLKELGLIDTEQRREASGA